MANVITTLLKHLTKGASSVPAEVISQQLHQMAPEDIQRLLHQGVTPAMVQSILMDEVTENFNRQSIYDNVEKSLIHWMMSSAVELFAEEATKFSALQNATFWVSSPDAAVQEELEALLADLEIESRIYDWAYCVCLYGDLFIKVESIPSSGVVSIDDTLHPLSVTKASYKGRVLGFYETSTNTGSASENTRELLPPWEYVHLKLGGAKKRRMRQGDSYMESTSVFMMTPEARQVSIEYGTSVLLNGLLQYRRLKLAEDSLLMTRITRGILRYVYKVKVAGDNVESIGSILESYTLALKQARSVDTAENGRGMTQQLDNMSAVDDIIIPVFGDSNDLSVEKIGGEPDIKWIVDIEMLRNQLAASLRVPTAMLGAFTNEVSGALGSESLSKLDIRFASSVRKVQRCIKLGLMQLCQTHLAFKGISPDVEFDIKCQESSSSAEIDDLAESLLSKISVIDKFMGMIDDVTKDIDKVQLFTYLNKKFLALDDFDLQDFRDIFSLQDGDDVSEGQEKQIAALMEKIEQSSKPRRSNTTSRKTAMTVVERKEWVKDYGDMKVRIEEEK